MAAFTALVLRTKERKGPDGEVSYYEAAELFGLISGFCRHPHGKGHNANAEDGRVF